MTLRRKTLLLIGLALAGVILLLYLTASAVLLNSFNDLETETSQHNLERVANAITESMTNLDVITEDYAGWDDSYNYMVDRNQHYLDDNFFLESLVGLDVNLVALYDQNGNLIFGRSLDLYQAIETPLPAGLAPLMAAGSDLLLTGLDEGAVGIILLDEGPMMLAARPILPSLGHAPPRGVMLFGRYLDQQEIDRLSALTNLEISLHQLDTINPDSPLAAVRSSLSPANHSLIEPLNSQVIAGYTLLNSITGEPALLLQVNQPRAIYQQGLASIRYLLFSLVAVGLVAGAVTLFLVERFVLARLARLSGDVGRIGASGEPTERVTMTGRPDELSYLAGDINQMLTSLERTQNSLRESENRYRAVVQQASEGIFLIDAQTLRILEANQAFQQMLGYSTEELASLTIYDITADDPAAVQVETERTVQKGHHSASERRYRRKDGTLIDVEISASLITSGGRQVLCTVAHDITARKRADKELQRLLRETLLLNRIIAAAGTALNPQDVLRTVCEELAMALRLPQTAFAVLDSTGERLTVIAEYVARGRPSALNVVIPVADNPATKTVLKSRQPLYIADVSTDPRYIPMREIARGRGTVSLLLLPLLVRDRVIGTLGLNAIERREFTADEIALAQNVAAATSQALENAQLYAAVQQELADRKRAEAEALKAREAAEVANQAKSEFISTVSHELKVPMATIRGYAELTAKGAAGPVSERQTEFLTIIQDNVERMSRIVSDLSDISRIEAGRLQLEISDVPLAEVVAQVARSARSQLEAKEQRLNLALPPDLPPLRADRSRLAQIMTNLVSNAHKYTPAGGHLTITAQCCSPAAEPTLGLPAVHISVSDNGIGIGPEDQSMLFQKFFRSGNEAARGIPGTGLGLSITKELVELQGGRIWLESQLGTGTTFHVLIPASVPQK